MNIWRPYTQMKDQWNFPKVHRAKGAYLYLGNGQRIFDGISSWWVITHGHCDEEIMEAIRSQTRELDQVIFSNFSHEPAQELASALSEYLPIDLNYMFFSDNGSTAVEVALKMSIQAQAQKGFPNKRKILSFEKAYHGDTAGAMSVSGPSLFTRAYHPLLIEFIYAKQAYHSFDSAENYTADFIKKINEHSDEIAAVIIEPIIQGAGGMIIWPTEALRVIRKYCEEKNIYLIFDEVMTGFGRTGRMFAFEHTGIVPDFLCLSKGLTGGSLPLSLTLTTQEVYEAFLSDEKNKMFFHGHSFTANPIACAAAVANLKKFKSEEVLKNVLVIEKAHQNALEKIKISHISCRIKDIRFKGAIGVLELNDASFTYGSPMSKRLTDTLLQDGLFIRALGNIIYLIPPYCSSYAEVTQSWEKILSALT